MSFSSGEGRVGLRVRQPTQFTHRARVTSVEVAADGAWVCDLDLDLGGELRRVVLWYPSDFYLPRVLLRR